MSYCIVTGCKNRRSNKNYEQLEKESGNNTISFHVFPTNIERKNRWLEALNLQNYNPPKTGAVCSDHFKEENYILELSLRRLKKDAVPYLPEEKYALNNNSTNNINRAEITVDDNKAAIGKEISEFLLSTETYENTVIKTEVNYESHRHRATSVSPERIFNSPTMIQLRKVHSTEIRKLKNKLYNTSYSLKKARSTIKSLKLTIKDLEKRKLLPPWKSDVLKNLHPGQQQRGRRNNYEAYITNSEDENLEEDDEDQGSNIEDENLEEDDEDQDSNTEYEFLEEIDEDQGSNTKEQDGGRVNSQIEDARSKKPTSGDAKSNTDLNA